MLLGLLSVALAAVPLVLGPDGPVRLGPAPAGTGPEVGVDPASGGLVLEELEPTGGRWQWRGGQWQYDGEVLGPPEPPKDRSRTLVPDPVVPAKATGALPLGWRISMVGDVRFVWTEEGLLESVTTPQGRRRLLYDPDGLIKGIRWPDGGRVSIRYDAEGRVEELVGPGSEVWRYTWSDQGLTARNASGKSWVVRHQPDGWMAVQDEAARQARAQWQGGTLVRWTDPVGGTTNIITKRNHVQIQSPDGSRVGVPVENGRPVGVQFNQAGGWSWTYDDLGRLTGIVDGQGHVTTWLRGDDGRVDQVVWGRRQLTLERDVQGRLVQLLLANGATLRLVRDDKGALTGIVDAVGNTVGLVGGDVPIEVVNRLGGRIGVSRDVRGRVTAVLDPVGGRVGLVRDAAGRVVRIEDNHHGVTRVDRRVDGLITRVVGPEGRVTGFIYGEDGQLRDVVRPDGQVVRLQRDAQGNVVGVDLGETHVAVGRDSMGRVVRVGDTAWRRQLDGAVVGVERGRVDLTLDRDAGGNLNRITSPNGFRLNVARDPVGVVTGLWGTDGDLRFQLDSNHRVVVESLNGEETVFERDPRGRIERIHHGEWLWDLAWDAGESPLMVTGPGGIRLGSDRDRVGRPTMTRFPDGTLHRRRYEEAKVFETVEGPDGDVLLVQASVLDSQGNPRRREDADGQVTVWRRGPNTEIVAVESTSGTWSWMPDGVAGPNGEVLVFEDTGHLSDARPPAWPTAWGVASEVMEVGRDPWGRIAEVVGEGTRVLVEHDGLDRLSAVEAERGQRWGLAYDPVGRLNVVGLPSGDEVGLVWSEEGLLAEGHRPWVSQSTGPMTTMGKDGPVGIVRDLRGDPAMLVAGDQVPVPINPLGYLETDALGRIAFGRWIRLFSGGPLVQGGIALDAVSGQRTDGWLGWPWQPRTLRGGTALESWDPSRWEPTAPWSEPLQILADMTEMALPHDEPWINLPPDHGGFAMLPKALQDGGPPFGPPLSAVPIDEGPLARLVLAILLQGGHTLEADWVTALALRDELQVPWLPPGLVVPGLQRWTKAIEEVDQLAPGHRDDAAL